ncbi:transcription factor SRM1 [Medicago truncatula]|uniref:Myb-like transcription factor family protein n=1 Tax=Medicago truncatula TaxID=3880 RepID=A0A072TS07_MEDTR|nr:transcription factor SRM1 [Medicago truncatula]KEH19961.1 myb-like transcription factor family protein [Medicago truncatula]
MDEVSSEWSSEQNKLFEYALANYPDDVVDRWEKIAAGVPGKTLEQIKHHYEVLVDDIHNIESGFVPLPDYDSFSNSTKCTIVKKGTKASGSYHWTEDEHRLFLMGVEKYGKGKWKKISENYVVTKTHTQIASHAQKYFKGLNSTKEKKERRRSSRHDVTYVENGDISAPHGAITGQASDYARQSATQTPQAPSAGTRTLNDPPVPPAGMYVVTPPSGVGVYAAHRIGQPIGGRNCTPGQMAYGIGPVSWTSMPGVPMNLGPMTFPMQNTYAHL